MGTVKTITPSELHRLIREKGDLRLIDVRSITEFAEKHIAEAEHFPIARIEAEDFPQMKNQFVITVCGSGGGRSARSAKMLSERWGRDVYYLDGGTFGWFRFEEEIRQVKETFFQRFLKTGHLPKDSPSEKNKKSFLLLASFPFALIGFIWSTIYYMNGLSQAAWIPLAYGILSLLSVITFIIWKKFDLFRFSQVLFILILPFMLQLTLGGLVSSGAVILWALVSPLGALTFFDTRRSAWWLVAFIVLMLAAFVIDRSLLSDPDFRVSEKFMNMQLLINVGGVSIVVFLMHFFYVRQQDRLKKAVETQSIEIAENHKSITDSINYARRIQFTLLAHDELLKSNLKDHFVLFKPKDIVSGDFYWATRRNEKFYLAVCDSTGHGVPGAFMSLLNISFLNEAVNEKGLEAPDEILNHVRLRLIESISQDGGKDGMDGILLCVDHRLKKLTYAAGYNSPFLVSGTSGKTLGADKMPIGLGEIQRAFSLHHVDYKEGDAFYLLTDGYTDQFGGPKGKKFKSKRLNELLVSLGNVPLEEQKTVLDAIITEWQGALEQTDDILVLGIRL